jgi:hypothetical protein
MGKHLFRRSQKCEAVLKSSLNQTEQAFFMLSDFPYLLRATILKRFPAWGSEMLRPSDLVS